jgi:hypothetical protein
MDNLDDLALRHVKGILRKRSEVRKKIQEWLCKCHAD